MNTFVSRTLEDQIRRRLTGEPRKIIILYGQRQVGKTTLAQHIFQSMKDQKVLRINADFNPLNMRDDTGGLWENFLFMERSKLLENHQIRANRFFWRLQTGAELDYVEEYEGKLAGFEFKFGNKFAKPPQAWHETYPEASFQTINRDNWLPFILETAESA